jgi:prevent-host-death family protein
MKSVGIRELKARLSEYVRQVRQGRTLLVTDHGEVVAELRPAGDASAQQATRRLEEALAAGWLVAAEQPGDRRWLELPEPLLEPGAAAALLDAERDES